MELATQADMYSPSIDEIGNYVDKIYYCKLGLYCPCGSRKDKIYDTNTMFSIHVKSKHHQSWLKNLNLNRANYYIENEKMKETLQNQQIIISKLDKEIQNKNLTIDYLTKQLTTKNNIVVNNLIDL